jgi:hypothetical protein
MSSSVDTLQQLLHQLDGITSSDSWDSDDVASVLQQIHKLAVNDILSPLVPAPDSVKALARCVCARVQREQRRPAMCARMRLCRLLQFALR